MTMADVLDPQSDLSTQNTVHGAPLNNGDSGNESLNNSDPPRERGNTITKKIPLSEYATLQGILAHQVDEGSACLKCGPDGCAGLDLHFWKKICKNCGCPRGAHKIERLIEEKKDVPRSLLIQTADEDESDYKELEISAPPHKTTIKGKSDQQDFSKYNAEYIAKIREFYKHKTVALDLPEDKKLTTEQLLILQQYINQSQGEEVVTEEALRTHLHLLARASNSELELSDEELHKAQSSTSLNSEDLPLHFLQALQLAQLNRDSLQSPRESMPRDRTPSYDSQVAEEDEIASRLSTLPLAPNSTNKSYQDSSYSDNTSEEERSIYRRPTETPRKPIRRNPGSFDELTGGDIADYYTEVNPSGDLPGNTTLQRKGSPGVWVPPNIDHALVKQYLAALPEEKRPVNTVGVQWRIKQLQTQLPRYDHNINYCHEMSPEEQEELFMFVESRKEKAQGQGEVKAIKKKNKKKCERCVEQVECGVIAEKIPGRVWHPECFSCTTCEEILVDLIYFQYDGRLYCGRHHAELLRPRCHACDELIFGQEFITADKHEYHKEHFCCWECDAGLGGTKYVSHKGQPYCQLCYEKLFCTRCVMCREPIGVGVPVYRHGSLRWHGNPHCFSCSFCKTSLIARSFMPTERHVYCSKNCYRCHESLKKTKGK